MHCPTPTNATTGHAAAATYTTIPISAANVISRSFQNVSAFLSRSRPWPEFIAAAASFDRPDSLAGSGIRLRLNFKYFIVNYAIVIAACAAVSLIGVPISLLVIALVFTLWLVLYFFREDPVMLWGYHVNDRALIVALILVSLFAVWFNGVLSNLLIGIGIGLLICAIHGVLKNPQGIFLDENDAVSNGLMRSTASGSYAGNFSNSHQNV